MSFDEMIERRGTHCAKWDKMEAVYGVPADKGIAMWVADMDFRPPQVVLEKLQSLVDHGVFGYFGDDSAYKDAIIWWMEHRHGWKPEADWIFTTHGLVNGTALCIDSFTSPGDGIVLMTPVYHAFARVIKAAGREIVECPLALEKGRYVLDIDRWDAAMTGSEKMIILCSPHNPGGRVWSREEVAAVSDFARRHDLVLVSDEIHQDIMMPGNRHVPAATVPGVTEKLVMMSATTKTFNIAGAHVGNVIIENPRMRDQFAERMAALGLSPNSFGLHMATAAYSPEGAAWVDALCGYLDGNRRLFDAAIGKIPGLASMPLEATYLAWVDFSGTGMAREEFTARVEKSAMIAANHGTTFGTGGDDFLRFNLATPKARIEEACGRLAEAFADLQ
ncbi:MalY/PatB family protein [Sulfitobacter sp. LCG007]